MSIVFCRCAPGPQNQHISLSVLVCAGVLVWSSGWRTVPLVYRCATALSDVSSSHMRCLAAGDAHQSHVTQRQAARVHARRPSCCEIFNREYFRGTERQRHRERPTPSVSRDPKSTHQPWCFVSWCADLEFRGRRTISRSSATCGRTHCCSPPPCTLAATA